MTRVVSKAEQKQRRLAKNHNLTVFDTNLSPEELVEIVKSFHDYRGGEYYGTAVEPSRDVPGMFGILSAGEFDPWPCIGAVRVVEGQLWTRRYPNQVAEALEQRGIGYIRAEATLPGTRAFGAETTPVNLKLEAKILESYTVMGSEDDLP